MLVVLLTLVYIVVSVFLILVVLLQTGKRADLAGAFGGGGSQTAFGARGAATVLTKATTIAACLFMITALALSIAKSQKGGAAGSVLDEVDPATVTAPLPPAPAPTDGASLPPGESPVGDDLGVATPEPADDGTATDAPPVDQP